MSRPRKHARSPRPQLVRTLHLGEWLARLGRKPVEAARAGGVTPQYISELISGKKKNPSPLVMLDISDWLGLSINDLYRPPPSPDVIQEIGRLTPATVERLRDEGKTTKRR